MAKERAKKSELSSFSLDVNFFTNKKIRLIKSEFGRSAIMIFIELLAKIYSNNGYYIFWSEENHFLFARETRTNPGKLKEIIWGFLRRDLFDPDKFFRYGILTSKEIQKKYFSEVARRSRIEAVNEYLLINPNEIGSEKSTNVRIEPLDKIIDKLKCSITARNADITLSNVDITACNVDISDNLKLTAKFNDYISSRNVNITACNAGITGCYADLTKKINNVQDIRKGYVDNFYCYITTRNVDLTSNKVDLTTRNVDFKSSYVKKDVLEQAQKEIKNNGSSINNDIDIDIDIDIENKDIINIITKFLEKHPKPDFRLYHNTKTTWINELEKLLSENLTTKEEILEIIEFIRGDEFWNKRFASLMMLNKKDKTGRTYLDVFRERLEISKKEKSNANNNGRQSYAGGGTNGGTNEKIPSPKRNTRGIAKAGKVASDFVI